MFFAKVYAPIIPAILLIAVALRYKFKENELFPIEIYRFKFYVTEKLAGRAICLLAALSIIPYYVTLDFTQFFPDRLDVEVFYDHQGLQSSMNVFTGEELTRLGYRTGNEHLAKEYDKDLDLKIKDLLKLDGFFSVSDGVVHSSGETTFEVARTKGIHNYHIEASKGELAHSLERPNHKTLKIKSFFEKLPSVHDYLRPTFRDILVKKEIVMAPRFRQIVAEQNLSDGVIFDHVLIGATKVYLFPYPSFSNTVYLFDSATGGSVPIGYAVYK